jgi:hypothetical protein
MGLFHPSNHSQTRTRLFWDCSAATRVPPDSTYYSPRVGRPRLKHASLLPAALEDRTRANKPFTSHHRLTGARRAICDTDIHIRHGQEGDQAERQSAAVVYQVPPSSRPSMCQSGHLERPHGYPSFHRTCVHRQRSRDSYHFNPPVRSCRIDASARSAHACMHMGDGATPIYWGHSTLLTPVNDQASYNTYRREPASSGNERTNLKGSWHSYVRIP